MVAQGPGLLVLDQDVFTRLNGHERSIKEIGIPIVLMVGHKTDRPMQRAKAAGVGKVKSCS
jgi:hypothetical protein